jgi:hypothetical protein
MNDWPPAVGEAIGLDRAGRALEQFDDAIREAGREVVARIQPMQPGIRVERKLFGARHLAGVVRSVQMPGCSVGYAAFLSSAGATTVVSLVLSWDGSVIAVGLREP